MSLHVGAVRRNLAAMNIMRRYSGLLSYVALALACAALYLPTLRFDFVGDAEGVILTNEYVQDLRNLADVATLRVMSQDVVDNNRPVFLISAMLDGALWGTRTLGYHLTNIMLHALATVLLFSFARRLIPGVSMWIPFFGALLFAVHPLNSEAVAEISYRKDLMAAAGILAGLNLAAVYRPVFAFRNLLIAGACVACFFMAVGAKENGSAGPALLIGYWLLFRRQEPRGGWIALCAVVTLTVVAFLVARFALPPFPSVVFTEKPPRLGGSFLNTLLIQPRVWTFYLSRMVYPAGLCADYTSFSIRNLSLGVSLVTVLTVVAGQVFLSIRNRMACMGMAIFWLSLLPASNFIPLYRPMADRFLYLPMCGAGLMLAGLLAMAKWRTRTLAVAAMIVAGCLAVVAFQRETVWRDSLTLWNNTAATNPFSSMAANNLGWALLDAGRPGEALQAAERCIALTRSEYADPLALKAIALDQLGRVADADAAYRKAVELDDRYRRPDSLVKALVFEPRNARQLEIIARRQEKR